MAQPLSHTDAKCSGENGIKMEEVISSFTDIKMECEENIKCDPVECLASKEMIDMQKQDCVSVTPNTEKPLVINDNPSESIPLDACGERQLGEETVSGVCCPKPLEIPATHSLAEGTVPKMNRGDFYRNVVSCLICSTYGDRNHKYTHMVTETYPCDDCGKSFSSRRYLLLHMLVHANDRQFSCRVCGKSFLRQDNLQSHGVTHGDEKLLSYAESGKSVPKRDRCCVLQAQIQSKRKGFHCPKCKRYFILNNSLGKAQELQIRSYAFNRLVIEKTVLICNACRDGGKSFSDSKHDRIHVVSRTGLRLTECPICERVLPKPANLWRHMQVHLPGKP